MWSRGHVFAGPLSLRSLAFRVPRHSCATSGGGLASLLHAVTDPRLLPLWSARSRLGQLDRGSKVFRPSEPLGCVRLRARDFSPLHTPPSLPRSLASFPRLRPSAPDPVRLRCPAVAPTRAPGTAHNMLAINHYTSVLLAQIPPPPHLSRSVV